MPAIAGLRGTGDWGVDERPKNFRELILYRNPNGTAPIFALTARVQKETTDDPEFSWWDEPNDLVRLTVSGALGASDTTVVVSSGDPDASNPDRVYGSAFNLVPGDLLLVEPASEAATFDHEVVKVTQVISATQFTVERAFAGSTAAAIADGASLLKIGNSFAEGSAVPSSASRNPIKYYNYTQIFKTTYEVSGTAAKTRARTGDILANEKRRKAFDHSRDIEMSILFGRRSETIGDNGKPERTMDGLRRFISGKTSTILAATTVTNFLNAVYPVFDYDTPAGDTRIAFCGNAALNALNLMIQTDAGTQIQYGGVIQQYGMNFREFVLPQGRLALRTHPLMNRHPLYQKSMFIIDFSALRWRPLRGRDTSFKDNIQSPNEDLVRGRWQTEAGIEVRYGGLTCGYIGNIT